MYNDGSFAEGFIAGSNNGNNNGFGNGWEGLIGLALVAGLFNGGWGFGGGFGGGAGFAGDFAGWQLGRLATTNDVANGFSTSEIMSDLNDIILGQAQMQNFINQGFAGINQTVTNGFAGVNNAICTLGYQNQAGFNGIANQIASCCCDVKSLLLENRYLNERQTCDLITNANNNTRQILDYLTGEKISALQSENAGLKAQISNDRQSAYLLSELKECPKAAYIVPNPNCCYNYGVTGFGYGNPCGASVV